MSEIEKIIQEDAQEVVKEPVVKTETVDTSIDMQKQIKELQFENAYRDLLSTSPAIKDYRGEIKEKVDAFGISVGDAAVLVLNSHNQLASKHDSLGGSAPTVSLERKAPETREELADAVRDLIERGEIQFN